MDRENREGGNEIDQLEMAAAIRATSPPIRDRNGDKIDQSTVSAAKINQLELR